MKKINFCMAIHFHQPVDNFAHVFELAYEQSYGPFIQILEKYPSIKLTLHYSGSLLEWIEANRPELIERLRALVERGQIEIMTGGFYEPILSIIPREDSLGQIFMLTEYIKDRFGFDPIGLWLTERIWEPQLPSLLYDGGIKYAIVDDTHFKFAGLSDDGLYHYYTTEDQGKCINLFASSEQLRYTIPFREPHESIDFLRSIATEKGNRVIVYGDDGEKFGLWPGTYNWVYEQKWLERFFEALLKESSWINLLKFSEVLEQFQPSGVIYIPTASYREMMEWTLPVERQKELERLYEEVKAHRMDASLLPFLRGGFWRNFLSKYPEANNMHKRMLAASHKLHRFTSQGPELIRDMGKTLASKREGSPSPIHKAYLELWRGQVNCPYWHGVFGGLYLPHLRSAVYRHLIKAEQLIDHAIHGDREWLEREIYDFDCDGGNEILLSTRYLYLRIDPNKGGMISEIDFKPSRINLLNNLARRKEAYHANIVKSVSPQENESSPRSIHEIVKAKEENLHEYLFYDLYRRGVLVDHLYRGDTNIEKIYKNCYEEIEKLPENIYDWYMEEGEDNIKIILRSHIPYLQIEKHIQVFSSSAEIIITYLFYNPSRQSGEIWFGTEFNFHLSGSEEYKIFLNKLLLTTPNQFPSEHKDVSTLDVENKINNLHLQLKFSLPCDLWKYEVQTVSQSESGYEREYQSTAFIPNWKLKILEGERKEIKVYLNLQCLE